MSSAEARTKNRMDTVDWQRVDAMTDEDIARQIAEAPDVAPDMSDALERGEFELVWGRGWRLRPCGPSVRTT
jgi:hypothetical protein